MKEVHAGRDIIFGNKPLFERVYDRFAARLGFWGQIAAAVALLAWLCLWYWQHIEQMPLIDSVVSWLVEQSLPTADPNRFNIAVAKLQDDSEGHLKEQLINALRDFEPGQTKQDVNILSFDRQISSDGTEESEAAGDEQARKYLGRSGAQVLIWGSIFRSGATNAYRLYWTTSEKSKRPQDPYPAQDDFKLPPIFWKDLVNVLGLLVDSESARYFNSPGHFIADNLRPFVARVSQLFHGSQGQLGWKASTRGEVGRILAQGLCVLGDQSGDNQALQESIDVSQEVLKMTSRERHPLDWAATQNNLGVALTRLAESESGTQHLTEAVAAYRAALEERTQARVPLDWAATQNNLGIALVDIAERESGTQHLTEAVAAYRAALQEYTRKRVPLDWAETQNNLGGALTELGDHEVGTKHLVEAVAAYQDALRECTRKRAPLDWAGMQNNLGFALTELGDREVGTEHLVKAVAAYQDALREYTPGREQLDWAMTQLNLGRALRMLGEREGGTERLEDAVTAEGKAIQVYSREHKPGYRAMAELSLGLALTKLGKRETETQHLAEAVAAYGTALQEFTPERMPLLWAATESNLGSALTALGEREPGTEDLQKAVKTYRSALEQYTAERTPLQWAEAQSGLGDALRDLGERARNAGLLCEALKSHFDGWQVVGDAPHYASIAAMGMREDVKVLRKQFAPSVYQGCAEYEEVLKQIGRLD
jgi:tetratricopeptide (TPR) repeat protein